MKKRYTKRVKEEVETRLNSLLGTEFVTKSNNSILFKDKNFFSFLEEKYPKWEKVKEKLEFMGLNI